MKKKYVVIYNDGWSIIKEYFSSLEEAEKYARGIVRIEEEIEEEEDQK